MRRLDKEITNKEIINQILEKSNICRVAFFDEEFPYIVPMNFGFKENALYFHCALKGKKIDLIRKNSKVGFEIEEYHEIFKDKVSCNWTTFYKSIIGKGQIEILDDRKSKIEALDIIMQQHGKTDNEYGEKILAKMLVLKLNILEMTAKQSGK